MNFSEWYDNADMPTKDKDGNWYDIECGTYFSDYSEKKPVIKKIKSAERKRIESQISKRKKEIKEKMKFYDPKNWSSYSHEEKQVFYAFKNELEELAKTKITFPMLKVDGKTFEIKDFIKDRGGKWNVEEKCWYVPSDFHEEIIKKIGV